MLKEGVLNVLILVATGVVVEIDENTFNHLTVF